MIGRLQPAQVEQVLRRAGDDLYAAVIGTWGAAETALYSVHVY